MGLGKTVQALAYIQSLKERDALKGPCLVVMPTSLIANWQAETARFTPEMKTLTLHGKERLKRYSDASHADIVFTTYPLFRATAKRWRRSNGRLSFWTKRKPSRIPPRK